MIPTSVLIKLATLGLSEQQAEAVGKMLTEVETSTQAEADSVIDKSREKARARLQKWRDKQPQNVSKRFATSQDVSQPLTRVEDNLSKLEVTGKKEEGARQRASRLKADWTLPDEWLQGAIGEGMTRAAALASAERMKNWSLSAKDGAKLDWHATWRNWFRRDLAKATAPPDKPKKITHASMWRDEGRAQGLLPNGSSPHEIDGRLEASHGERLAPGPDPFGRIAGAGSG